MYVVQVGLVSRAIAAATSVAGALDLKVNDAIVIQNSNALALPDLAQISAQVGWLG
jgi:hypothetical protein